MIMYIYLRVLLECGGTRRRTDDLQAMMCQDSLLVVFGVCVPMNISDSSWAQLGECEISSTQILGEVQSIFMAVYVVSSGSSFVYMPDRKLRVITRAWFYDNAACTQK